MSDDLPPAKRLKLSDQQLESLSREELLQRCRDQDSFLESLESKFDGGLVAEVAHLRESEEKLKQQHVEACRRENVLVMRLTTKEQEMQEYLNQIQELKQAQNNSTAQLRSMLLDPAVNIMFQRMCKELEDKKQKLEQTQNDLSAWKFTPDSQTGKRLMAKCRMLLQENDELGKVTSSGRMAKLEGDIALEKTLVSEMKKGQAEMDEFLGELDEDVEGMQSTIYILQQQLKDARDEVSRLQVNNEELRKAQTNMKAFLPVNTVDKSGEISQDSTRTSPTNSKQNLPMGIKTEPDDMEVQSYYRTTKENVHPPTNGKKILPQTHDSESEMDVDRQQGAQFAKDGIQSYHISKNSNFRLSRNDHGSNNEENDNGSSTKTPAISIESPGSPTDGDWSPVKTTGSLAKGEGLNYPMDKEGALSSGGRTTDSVDRDTAVPNGLQTSPSYSSQEET